MQSRYFSTLPNLSDLDTLEFLPVNQNAQPLVDMGTQIAGEDIPNDILKVEDQANYTNASASALVKTGAGRVFGIVVNSHSSGTIKLWDNTAGSGTVLVNTFTFPAGSGVYKFPAALKFTTGLYMTIGGTADVTLAWK